MLWKFWKPKPFEPRPSDFDTIKLDPLPQFVHLTPETFDRWFAYQERKYSITKTEDKSE